jgi:hypothetical protein
VPLCCLPLTNPSSDPNLEPLTSPCSHGATDQPPAANACHATPKGGGSGGGSSGSAAGGKPIPRPVTNCQQRLSCLMNKLGATLSGLTGRTATAPTANKITNTNPSSMGFILVIVVVGVFLVMLSWNSINQ